MIWVYSRDRIVSLECTTPRLLACLPTSSLSFSSPRISLPDMDISEALGVALSGRYRIERELGRGGMATVYLADDLRHHRKVALKALRPELATVLGAERFLSEIQLTANLQHPHVLPLFDSGEADGLLYYVMPFVEGESLRDRLAREGQLPVQEAVRIGVAVAGALDYAHRRGVIHRDLKPANILLQDGHPLVADFGIALAVRAAGGERVTESGLTLGTPEYMSPEQAAGDRLIDARSDVYSWAAVIYEMLVGEPPHTARTVQALIAKLLTEPPQHLRSRRPSVPEHVEAAVLKGLEKLPADRLGTAGELADALQGRLVVTVGNGSGAAALEPGRAGTSGGHAGANGWTRLLRHPASIAVLALLIGVGIGRLSDARSSAVETTPIRFQLDLDAAVTAPSIGSVKPFAISADGRTLAIRGAQAGVVGIYLRRLEESEPRLIPGTEGAGMSALSPDGRSIVFQRAGELLRINLDGGAPLRLGEAGSGTSASWGQSGIVLGGTQGLLLVSSDGGPSLELTRTDPESEVGHFNPVWLPDGETVLFERRSRDSANSSHLGVASVRTTSWSLLDLAGTAPLGVADGMLVYSDGTQSLLGVPFDLDRLAVLGEAITLLEGIDVGPTGIPAAALSLNGTLVFLAAEDATSERELVAVSLVGTASPVTSLRRAFNHPRYSPDGRRVAVSVANAGTEEVSVIDLSSGTIDPLTRETLSHRPAWFPDGRSILYRSLRGGQFGLWRQAADGSGPAERFQSATEGQVTRSGEFLVYRTGTGANLDIWFRALVGDTTSHALAASPEFAEKSPSISSDGRWVAYASNESGAYQVYVRELSATGARYPVSVDGGDHPVWAREANRLYYRNGPELVEAALDLEPPFSVDRRVLFEFEDVQDAFHRSYDVAPDGSHFLMVRSIGEAGTRTHVILDWAAEVQAMVRTAESGPGPRG